VSNRAHDPLSVILTCRDLKASLAFFRERLEFELEACWPDEKSPMWANTMMGAQSVMLGQSMPAGAASQFCAGDAAAEKRFREMADDLAKNKSGVGIGVYVEVADVDQYHARLAKRGVAVESPPKTQFYGIREMSVLAPDGFRFYFYTPVKMESCQSCGMPLKDAKPGTMYCAYCTDASGKLKPYETVLEGTTTGYFMAMQKMARPQAETAAREHLAKMPAWATRK
jgi:uncharacterized glyoxalase superfamily protein PhnB